MADPRDPQAAERLAERRQKYHEAIAELDDDRHRSPQAIADCQLCDDDGYRGGRVVCDHIDRTDTARRGIARCREALAQKQLRLDEANR